MSSEQPDISSKINTPSQEEIQKLIEVYGQPIVLHNVSIKLGALQYDGQCPGNENALAAITLLQSNTNPEMARKVRERMRSRHALELIGPFIHFNVEGISPRILFTNLTIDKNGNVFKPGMLYSYNPGELTNIQKLLPETQNPNLGLINPINDIDVEITLNPLRRLQELPYQVRMTHLTDEDGNQPAIDPEFIARYLKDLLLNEVREEGGTLKFYKSLILELPEIFGDANSDIVIEVTPTKDWIYQSVVGEPENRSQTLNLVPGRQYKAIQNPLNTIYPQNQATYIIDGGKGYYFFVPANEVSEVVQSSAA